MCLMPLSYPYYRSTEKCRDRVPERISETPKSSSKTLRNSDLFGAAVVKFIPVFIGSNTFLNTWLRTRWSGVRIPPDAPCKR